MWEKNIPLLLCSLMLMSFSAYALYEGNEVGSFTNSVSHTALSTLLASHAYFKDSESKIMIDHLQKRYKFPELNEALVESVAKRSSIILEEICLSIDKDINTTIVFLGAGFTTLPYKIGEFTNINVVLVDFEDVLYERKSSLNEENQFHYVSIVNSNDHPFSEKVKEKIDELNSDNVVIVAEGLTLYLSKNQNSEWIESALSLQKTVTIIMDVYSSLISYFSDEYSKKEQKFLPNTDIEICTENSLLCKSMPYSKIYSSDSYWITKISHKIIQYIPFIWLKNLSNILMNSSRILVIKQRNLNL